MKLNILSAKSSSVNEHLKTITEEFHCLNLHQIKADKMQNNTPV